MSVVRGIRADQVRLQTDGGLQAVGPAAYLGVAPYFGETPPDDPFDGMCWIDSSANAGDPPYEMKRWNAVRVVWEIVAGAIAVSSAYTKLNFLTGAINGMNNVFTIPELYVHGSFVLVINGRIVPDGYVLSGPFYQTVTLTSNITPPSGTDWIGGLYTVQI